MKLFIFLILVLLSLIHSEEEMIGNQRIQSLQTDGKFLSDSQYGYRQKKKWQASLSLAYNALSLSYNIAPNFTIGFRVNDLNRVNADSYGDGVDFRTLIAGESNAIILYEKRESRTSFGKVYPRENFFFQYYPSSSLSNNFPIYFAFNLGRTYGTFREEVDLLNYKTEPIRDPDATVDRRTIQNGYPMTYRRVSEKPNYYFGWGLGFKWITFSGLFFGTEIGTSYRAKPEIEVLVMPVPWNREPISLYDIGVMRNALIAEYESRVTFPMHYLFTLGYAF